MKKAATIVIGLFLYWNNLFCQYDQKYLNYRERFRKYFTVVGSGQGESNVLVTRNGRERGNHLAGATEIRIGNQMMNLGDYIAMLAMEYKILSEAGQNTSQTAKELYYALYAFNRIDYVAETHFGMSAELNGFFIRDDVYAGTDFISSHPQLNDGLAPPCSTCTLVPCSTCTFVDYDFGSGEVQWVDHTVGAVTSSSFQFPSACTDPNTDANNDFDDQEDFQTTDLPSPDEIAGLFFGMAMVVKCVPPAANYNGLAMNDADENVNFVDAAKNITDRIAIWLKDHSWDIESPTGCTIWGGLSGSPDPLKYAYATAAGEIMGNPDKYRNISMNGINWCATDPFFDIFHSNKQSINVKIVCMLAIIGDSWNCVWGIFEKTYERIVEHTSNYTNWKYFYPLIYTVLHGGVNSISLSEVENLLALAPDNGPFNHNTANNPNDFGSNGWCTPFLFRADNDEQPGVDDAGIATADPGNYSGLDFMLLHNLYKIVKANTPAPLPPNCTFSTEQPDKVYNVSQDIDGTEEKHFKNSITTQSGKSIVIKSGANVWWTAGNFIELNDGFETEDGATFTAEIIECNELFGRMASDSSRNYTKANGDMTASVKNSSETGVGNSETKSKGKSASKSENNQQPETSIQKESVIAINPNPSTDGKFNLTCTVQDVGCMKAEITVMDMLGQIIHKEPLRQYVFPLEIDLSSQPKGAYFIKIQNNETVLVYKVVVQ